MEKQKQLSTMQTQTEELEASLEKLTTLKRQVDRPRAPRATRAQAAGSPYRAAVPGPWARPPADQPSPPVGGTAKCLVTLRLSHTH